MQAFCQSPACEIPGLSSPTSIAGFKDIWYLTGSGPGQKGLTSMYKLMEIIVLKVENTQCCTNVKVYCDSECF